jgi:hypothetical protein
MTTTENYVGSNCTGASGSTNRTLTILNAYLTTDDEFEVFVNNSFLHNTVDYTVNHKSSSSIITFLNNIWDDQNITVIYTTTKEITYTKYQQPSVLTALQDGFSDILTNGEKIRIKYYDTSFGAGSYYDDDITLTQSGTDYWTSGIIMPINTSKGSAESILVEQGKLLTNDSKLYINGDINVSGTIKIKRGTEEYNLLSEGVNKWDIQGDDIYKKLYIRRLTTGSLYGES